MSVKAGLSVPAQNSGDSFALTSEAWGDHLEMHSWHLFWMWYQISQRGPSLTPDFLHQRKQIRSLFLTNRSELSFSCLCPPKKKTRDKSACYCAYKLQNETFRRQKQLLQEPEIMTHQWWCSPAGQTRWWSACQRQQGRDRTVSTRSQPEQACNWWTQEIGHFPNYSAMITLSVHTVGS